MATAETLVETSETVADLIERLGDIDPSRILLNPPPGTATEGHLLEPGRKLCELIDGVLVRKAMGYREAFLATALSAFIREFVSAHKMGLVAGADATLRIALGLVRHPDISYISWDRLPGRRIPTEPIPPVAPDLAVEVLSEGNTPREMARKRREFFEVGTLLIWEVDPRRRIVAVYRDPERAEILTESGTLDGGEVLPGFALRLADLFAELDRQG